MTEPTLFDPQGTHEPVPPRGQRLAFTGDGKHWHGTVTGNLTHDGKPRVRVDVDSNSYGISTVVFRLGPHFRPTVKGEACPNCGTPDPGEPMYGRYF